VYFVTSSVSGPLGSWEGEPIWAGGIGTGSIFFWKVEVSILLLWISMLRSKKFVAMDGSLVTQLREPQECRSFLKFSHVCVLSD
jgi:hypothetical protein